MEYKKTITITLQVKELIYDIQNKAYLTGQAREAEGKSFVAVSNMQASDDEENSYQIRRSLSNAFSALKCQLGEYLAESESKNNNRINGKIDNDAALELTFKLPNNYNGVSSDSVGDSIHAYLVDAAMSDWFSITNKEDADIYIAHAAISMENVKRALFKRSRPERPTYDV